MCNMQYLECKCTSDMCAILCQSILLALDSHEIIVLRSIDSVTKCLASAKYFPIELIDSTRSQVTDKRFVAHTTASLKKITLPIRLDEKMVSRSTRFHHFLLTFTKLRWKDFSGMNPHARVWSVCWVHARIRKP